MSGRRYRVVERFPWIEGGAPIEIDTAPGWKWEGGKDVTYEPGDVVYIDDEDLPDIYHRLEAIDEAGRLVLEEICAQVEGSANILSSLDAEQHNFLACGLARTKMAQGEEPKEALLWALRNGANLPGDFDRTWVADALEGKLKRGRGRPRKEHRRDWIWDYVRDIMEAGMVQAYSRWRADFQRDRELAWLSFEALRLREKQPDAEIWRRSFDLGTETDRQAYEKALKALGARRCPTALKGEKTPSELAREATVREYKQRWKEAGGRKLTPSFVARIVTRANKSE